MKESTIYKHSVLELSTVFEKLFGLFSSCILRSPTLCVTCRRGFMNKTYQLNAISVLLFTLYYLKVTLPSENFIVKF